MAMIMYPLDQALHINGVTIGGSVIYNMPVEALGAVGPGCSFANMNALTSGSSSAYQTLWDGVRVLNSTSGLEYKVYKLVEYNVNPGTTDWGYIPQPSSMVQVERVSTATIPNLAGSISGATYFGAALVKGKLYLVRHQGTNVYTAHADNGIYMATSTSTLMKYTEFVTEESANPGSPPVTSRTFVHSHLRQALVYCLSDGYTYRANSGTASTVFYLVDDFVNNSYLGVDEANSLLTLASGKSLKLLQGDFSVFYGGAYKFKVVGSTGLATATALAIDTTLNVTGASTLTGGISTYSIDTITAGTIIHLYNGSTSTVNIANNITTLNIANVTTANHTVNISGGATAELATKSINIGGNGVSGSTTNINFGSSVSGAKGRAVFNNPVRAAYYSASNNTGTLNIDLALANVFYYWVDRTTTVGIVQAASDGINDLTNYLGNTISITIRNSNSTSIDVTFNDSLFQFGSKTITLSQYQAVSYTASINGVLNTTASYFMDGVLAPSYQSLV